MPKFLFQASYTREGVKGLMNEGGTRRAKAIGEAMKSTGGSMEAFYFAFGENDVYAIADLPDEATAAAISLAVAAGGALSVKTTVLIDPETMDDAVNRSVSYTPPKS